MTSYADLINLVLDSLAATHPDLKNSGFSHVANLGQLHVEMPYRLADDLQIRRASPNEVKTLQKLLEITRPSTLMAPSRNPYETAVHSTETAPGTVSYSTTQLPEDQWRYHVIAFEGTDETFHDFIESTVLTKWRLVRGPRLIANSWLRTPTFVGGPSTGRIWEELSHSDMPFLRLGQAELDDLRLVYQHLIALKDDRVNLRGAMKRFEQLDAIPRSSPMRFLGYVSVLESLITHAPEPKDPYDSLTRQVTQKMLLVGRRSRIPIPYELFDTGVRLDTLWKRLYAYRSTIAHGANADFQGELRCLKDAATALEFISCATVALVRQVLEEPDLIADLRAC